jgi:hypothetical protein
MQAPDKIFGGKLPFSLLWLAGMILNLAPLVPVSLGRTLGKLPQYCWHDCMGVLGCSMLVHVSQCKQQLKNS